MTADTIVAIATPPGRGGVGIVRVSGPDAAAMAVKILGFEPKPRHAHRARFKDAGGATIDDGLALYFPAPDSFTGEHVLELHGHGGPVVLDLLRTRVLELGARHARPGEFTERAFLNGKLDLAQAEAVADLIDSHSAQAVRAATRSLAGEFSALVQSLVDDAGDLRAFVEAAIDFPDEEIDFLADDGVAVRLRALIERLDTIAATAARGAKLRDGLVVVIAGAPNAGKSSLLNRLAGNDVAIVTPTPGTTRDPLREDIELDGLPVRIVDTAGLRADGDDIEREGMRRARAELDRADLVLLVVDATTEPADHPMLPDSLRITARNKIDLTGETAGPVDGDADTVRVSALTGAGIDALRSRITAAAGWSGGEGAFSARARHLDALARARVHLDAGREALDRTRAGELLAEELRLAGTALGEITGAETVEDLLGRVFSKFCIGK